MDFSSDALKVRRFVQKSLSTRCIYLSQDALNYIVEYTTELSRGEKQATIDSLAEAIEKAGGDAGLISLEKIKELVGHHDQREETARKAANASLRDSHTTLENASEQKRLVFDKTSKCFIPYGKQEIAESKLSFHALRERFEMAIASLDPACLSELSSVDMLYTTHRASVKILAMLTRGVGDTFVAEDLNGSVRLSMKRAAYRPGLYFEGGIYVFSGVYTAGVLDVESVALAKTQEKGRCFAEKEIGWVVEDRDTGEKPAPNDRIVLISDVHLDNPQVMRALFHLLSRFTASPPSVFVLCGPFLSTQPSYGYMEAAVAPFRHLANILNEFAKPYKASRYILVPSATDPSPLQFFPRLPLAPTIRELFRGNSNVQFASNPCRLTFKGQQIMILCDNLVEKLCRTAIHVPVLPGDISQAFCDTVWSQRHLSPLPLYYNTILPQFDYLFHLWPAPEVVVVADHFKAFDVPESHSNSLMLNPGSFPLSKFSFQLYYPASGKVETSSIELPE